MAATRILFPIRMSRFPTGAGRSIPSILRYALNTLYERYENPMFIVENGLGAYDRLEADKSCDDSWIDYLRAHIRQMKKAVEYDGVDLMGYTPWGCIDVVSFTTGELAKRYTDSSMWISMMTAAARREVSQEILPTGTRT